MKEKLYRKEIWITIIFTILLMLMGHTATLFRIFGGTEGSTGTFWGFPTHYIIPIITGWFGIMVVCAIQAYVCNQFDDEMEAFAEQSKNSKVGVSE